jgi:hypothetical protein
MCLAANIIEMNKNENYPVRKSQNNGDRMAENWTGFIYQPSLRAERGNRLLTETVFEF